MKEAPCKDLVTSTMATPPPTRMTGWSPAQTLKKLKNIHGKVNELLKTCLKRLSFEQCVFMRYSALKDYS